MTDEDDLRESILRESTGGRISCKALLELAEWQETTPRKLGRLCNQMEIKITDCQLGCFK